jgi:hypothetical protein
MLLSRGSLRALDSLPSVEAGSAGNSSSSASGLRFLPPINAVMSRDSIVRQDKSEKSATRPNRVFVLRDSPGNDTDVPRLFLSDVKPTLSNY